MGLLTRLGRRVIGGALSRAFRPAIAVVPGARLTRLGSDYGGWTVEDAADLVGCHVISAGLGEDASFDVEIAARYGATVAIVDPTPRAIVHFDAIVARPGQPACRAYVAGGRQPVDAYDLSAITPDQLRMVPKALWISAEPVRFHKPANPDHVSHSITFAAGGDFITVPTVLLTDLLAAAPADAAILLKMDIEGAEIDILATIADWPRLPRQILVEFDVLRRPGPRSRAEVERTDRLLAAHGYHCRHFDGERNYLYVR